MTNSNFVLQLVTATLSLLSVAACSTAAQMGKRETNAQVSKSPASHDAAAKPVSFCALVGATSGSDEADCREQIRAVDAKLHAQAALNEPECMVLTRTTELAAYFGLTADADGASNCMSLFGAGGVLALIAPESASDPISEQSPSPQPGSESSDVAWDGSLRTRPGTSSGNSDGSSGSNQFGPAGDDPAGPGVNPGGGDLAGGDHEWGDGGNCPICGMG